MHRLRIILEVATRGVQSGFKTASGAVRSFLNSLSNMASSGRRFLDSLAQSVFFLGQAFGMLKNAARSVFDAFVGTAGTAAKLEVRLKNITGSSADAARVMELLDQVARQTGASFENLGEAAVLVSVMAKDASGAFDIEKFERLNEMLMAMAAFTGPRVPIERLARGLAQFVTTGNITSLEMFLDVLLGTKKAAEDVTDIPGEIGKAATFITLAAGDAAEDAAGDLDWLASQLDRLGIGIGLVQDMAELSGIERFNETLQSIARVVGEPLFEALNEGMAELAGWLQANPELIDQFATSLGKLGAAGIEKVFESVTNMLAATDWEKFFDNATKFLELLTAGDIEGAFNVVGLGDLGVDLKDAVASLGDIAEALAIIANWILKLAELGKAAEKPREVKERARAKGLEVEEQALALGLPQWLTDILGAAETIRGLTGPGLAETVAQTVLGKLEAQKVEVEITLDNALLNAQITQGAEETTVRAFDEVHRSYQERNR